MKRRSTTSPRGRSTKSAQSAVVADEVARLRAGGQRLGERREQPLREHRGVGVERVPGVGVGLGADTCEGRSGCRVVGLAVDEQAALGVGGVGGVRREPPSHEPHVEPEVVDDATGQEAHEVGVAGEPRVDALERLRRHGGAAEVVVALEEQHGEAGAGEVGGGREAVVAAAEDHDVVGHPTSVRDAADAASRGAATAADAAYRSRDHRPGRRPRHPLDAVVRARQLRPAHGAHARDDADRARDGRRDHAADHRGGAEVAGEQRALGADQVAQRVHRGGDLHPLGAVVERQQHAREDHQREQQRLVHHPEHPVAVAAGERERVAERAEADAEHREHQRGRRRGPARRGGTRTAPPRARRSCPG